jgi:hypothetical protein
MNAQKKSAKKRSSGQSKVVVSEINGNLESGVHVIKTKDNSKQKNEEFQRAMNLLIFGQRLGSYLNERNKNA